MTEDRNDLIRHYRDSRALLLAAIEGLREELLVEPSLDGWAVKDHLAHIAAWDEIRAGDVVRISAGFDSAWRMAEGRSDDLGDILHEARRGLSLAQVIWELEDTRARLLDSLAAATPAGLDSSRYGEAALRSDHEFEHAGWIREWRTTKGV